MFLIVSDSFELSSQNPTDAEKASRTETWSRVLFSIIPEKHLQECFDRAFKNHTGKFPVSAYDLKAVWPEVKHELQQREIDSRRTLPDTAASDCPRCFGTGMWNPDGKGSRYGCPHGGEG